MKSLPRRSIRRPLILLLAALFAGGIAAPASAAGLTPTAPTNVVATAGNHQATITWDAPSSMGAGGFLRYEVATAGPVQRCSSTDANTLTCTATGLTNGQAYSFYVRAVTVLGNGDWSQPSSAVVPGTPPTAPTNVVATAGDSQATITWDASSSMGTGTFVRYEVATPGPVQRCSSTDATILTCAATGLSNGLGYSFYVRAVTDEGPGPWSSASNGVVPHVTGGVPTGPDAPSADPGDTEATITWTDPSDFGTGTWVKWEVATEDGTIVCTVTTQTTHSCTAENLTNDTAYTFKVRAVTSAGNGDWSALSTAVTPTADGEDTPVDVFRFWSEAFDNAHFYTADEDEADDIDANDPNWEYEGVAFQAFDADQDGNCTTGSPVFRFFSSEFESHFYTASESEADDVDANDPNWEYEGVAYCAFPTHEDGTVPLYRFWSDEFGKHFYTANQAEADHLKAADPNWSYEGIVSYVLPPD